MKRYIRSNIEVGDYIRTPRFHEVPISEVFDSEEECRAHGYSEPTNYWGNGYGILGKIISQSKMKFAAYVDEGQSEYPY